MAQLGIDPERDNRRRTHRRGPVPKLAARGVDYAECVTTIELEEEAEAIAQVSRSALSDDENDKTVEAIRASTIIKEWPRRSTAKSKAAGLAQERVTEMKEPIPFRDGRNPHGAALAVIQYLGGDPKTGKCFLPMSRRRRKAEPCYWQRRQGAGCVALLGQGHQGA